MNFLQFIALKMPGCQSHFFFLEAFSLGIRHCNTNNNNNCTICVCVRKLNYGCWVLDAVCQRQAKKKCCIGVESPLSAPQPSSSVCLSPHTHSHTNSMLCIFCLFIFSFHSKLCTKSYLLQRHSLSASCTSINARMRNGEQMKKNL